MLLDGEQSACPVMDDIRCEPSRQRFFLTLLSACFAVAAVAAYGIPPGCFFVDVVRFGCEWVTQRHKRDCFALSEDER